MSLAPPIANAVFRAAALTTSAEVMRGQPRRYPNDAGRADGVKDHGPSLVGVIAHRDVIRMIVKMDIRNRHLELILLGRVKSHAIGFLWHVFAHQPHSG